MEHTFYVSKNLADRGCTYLIWPKLKLILCIVHCENFHLNCATCYMWLTTFVSSIISYMSWFVFITKFVPSNKRNSRHRKQQTHEKIKYANFSIYSCIAFLLGLWVSLQYNTWKKKRKNIHFFTMIWNQCHVLCYWNCNWI